MFILLQKNFQKGKRKMKVRKKLKRLIAMAICLVMMLGGVMVTRAADNPYGKYQTIEGITTIRCTHFAWQQAYDNTGIALPNWGNAGNWFSSAQNANIDGISTGTEPRANSIAVWTGGAYIDGQYAGHVAYVTSVSGANTFTVNEGGRSDKLDTEGIAYGYTITNAVGETRPSDSSLTLAGFIYLDGTTNAWTQELNITDWTYGEAANTPTAAARYGTPVFTYSNERNGVYTSEVPKNAGTYYVKATVAATDQYTGLEAVKEFQIRKAVPEIPQGLTVTYGETLNFIGLPAWYTWNNPTQDVGDVGTKTFLATYNSFDGNYEVINNMEIPVTVLPADMTGILEMLNININENTNLNELGIMYGTELLVQGVDYKITTETNGNRVTVTLEFMGNFTGKDQTTYTLSGNTDGLGNASGDNLSEKEEGDSSKGSGSDKNNVNGDNSSADKGNIKNNLNNTVGKGVPKTGDTSLLFVWAAVAVLSGAASIVAIKKKNLSR